MAEEFVFGEIQRRVAPAADVGAGIHQLCVFTGEGTLGSFVDQHMGFERCQRVILTGTGAIAESFVVSAFEAFARRMHPD